MAQVTPRKGACNVGRRPDGRRATCDAARRHWRGARGPRRRRRRRAGGADGGAAARPPRASRCVVLERHAGALSRSPAPSTWTTRCSACCRRPASPTRCSPRSRPMAGLRLLDGGAPGARRVPRATRTRARNGWPQGSLVHQPDLEDVLAAAAGRAPGIAVRRGAEVTGLTPGRRRRHRRRPGRRGGPVRPGRGGARLRRRGQHRARADRRVDARPRPGRPLAGARRPVAASRCRCGRGRTRSATRAGRRRSCRSPATGTAGSAGWRRGRRSPRRTAPDRLAGAARAGRPGGRRDRPRRRVHVPRAGGRPVAGRPGAPGRRRRPPEPAVHRAGAGAGAARRAPAGLEAGRRPRAARPGDELLDTYQAEREPHARALIRLARLLGRLMTGGGRAGDVLRRGVLAVVRRIPAVARLATDSRTPPLAAGPQVDRRGRAGRRLAGTLVPQPEVRRRRTALPPRRRAGDRGRRATPLRPGFVVRRDDGTEVAVEDLRGSLQRWMGRAAVVEVRPDRIVQAAR